MKPFVSIIIPSFQEQDFIAKCLDSILRQDYPEERMEVLVADGMSRDNTRKIVGNYAEKIPFIKLLDNPQRFACFAFNIGIKHSKGDIIMIMGAHAGYQKDYISKCVSRLQMSGADNVGGILKTKPSKNTLAAKAIVFCLANPFAAGGSFRIDCGQPKEVDTVFGGCYKKEVFKRIGLFNEKLSRSQDMEFNIRLKKAGGKILLFPDIEVDYYPKNNLYDFFIHNFWDGVWAVYPLKFTKIPLKLRHYAPLLFVSALAAALFAGLYDKRYFIVLGLLLFLYLLPVLLISAKIAIKEKNWRYLFLEPLAFAVRHFGYGIGSFYGLIKLVLPEKNGRKDKKGN